MTATGAMRCDVIMKGIGFRMPQEAPVTMSNEIPGQTPQKKRVPHPREPFREEVNPSPRDFPLLR